MSKYHMSIDKSSPRGRSSDWDIKRSSKRT